MNNVLSDHARWLTIEHVWRRSLAGVALACMLPAVASAAGPWFGLRLPTAASDPAKPVLQFNNAIQPLPVKITDVSGPVLNDPALGGEALAADLKKIISFSYESRAAGDTLWGRMSGMPSMHHTMEWFVNECRAAGITDAKVDDFTTQLWWPKSWEVRLIGKDVFGEGTQDLVLPSAFPQNSGAGEVTAPLVFVGHGTAAELAGKDLKGKIAVLHVRPDPSLFSAPERGVPARLSEQGAVAVISIIESPGNMFYFDGRFGRGSGPCFTLGGRDGYFLEQLIGEAGKADKLPELTACVRLESETKTGLTSANGVAILPGRSRKNIIINAHADGFFQAADDNADGLATAICLARYFAKQPQLEHTLVFVASAGHHSPGNGVTNFIRMHPEIMQDTILAINIEHVAYQAHSRGSTAQRDNFGNELVPSVMEGHKKVGVSNSSPFLIDLWRNGAARFGIVTSQVVDTGVPGEGSGYARSVPATQMIGSSVFYHSSGDTLELVPVPGMERAARFHAWFIQEVDRAPEKSLEGARPRRESAN